MYYYNARYYDPTIGRFISPDSIVPNPANPQAFNRYSYCLNNPLRYVDPSGHVIEYAKEMDCGRIWVKDSVEGWLMYDPMTEKECIRANDLSHGQALAALYIYYQRNNISIIPDGYNDYVTKSDIQVAARIDSIGIKPLKLPPTKQEFNSSYIGGNTAKLYPNDGKIHVDPIGGNSAELWPYYPDVDLVGQDLDRLKDFVVHAPAHAPEAFLALIHGMHQGEITPDAVLLAAEMTCLTLTGATLSPFIGIAIVVTYVYLDTVEYQK